MGGADFTQMLTVLFVTVEIQGLHCPVVCSVVFSLFLLPSEPSEVRLIVSHALVVCPCVILVGVTLTRSSVSLTLTPVDTADDVCLCSCHFSVHLCQEMKFAAAPVCLTPVECPPYSSK